MLNRKLELKLLAVFLCAFFVTHAALASFIINPYAYVVAGGGGGAEDSYDVGISGFTYASKSKGITGDENNPRGLHLDSGGDEVYAVGTGSDTIYQYSLSTAWDISTAGSSVGSLSVATQTASPQGMDFCNDGDTVIIVANTGDVFSYSGTAWDIGTFSYNTDTYNPAEMSTGAEDVQVSQDGTKMWILVAATADTIYQYTLSTACDVSTASYDSKSFSVVSEDTLTNGFAMATTGDGFITCGNSNDEVFQYSMSTTDDISTASYDSVSFDISSEEGTVRGCANGDGSGGTALKAYVVGGTNDTIYQYE